MKNVFLKTSLMTVALMVMSACGKGNSSGGGSSNTSSRIGVLNNVTIESLRTKFETMNLGRTSPVGTQVVVIEKYSGYIDTFNLRVTDSSSEQINSLANNAYYETLNKRSPLILEILGSGNHNGRFVISSARINYTNGSTGSAYSIEAFDTNGYKYSTSLISFDLPMIASPLAVLNANGDWRTLTKSIKGKAIRSYVIPQNSLNMQNVQNTQNWQNWGTQNSGSLSTASIVRQTALTITVP